MAEIPLPGCMPEPLMSYLKALGVFRLVSEQIDLDARLAWRGGAAHLYGELDRDKLVTFFLEQYRPTPIVAPWNGGSGFYGGGSEPLDSITESSSLRYDLYRRTIGRIRSFVPASKPKDEAKDSLLMQCRSELADEVVPWLDVCFVLGESGASFFPLLGTGGNDGRLDFTNNFMQRLADVVSLTAETEATAESRAFLNAALFNDTLVSLGKSAIGQFSPGGIGGANGTQGKFEAESRVNPWDYVLMIEGALLFAGSVGRRMGVASTNRAVFPFSVDSVAVGYGSATASEETTDGSRAELWLPLWENPCGLPELTHIFAEGRAQFGRRQAKNAVEFALAVNLLGVNRGITSFIRYGFLRRNGLAFLATPLGRVEVRLRPQVHLLSDPPLALWIDRLRRACSDKDKTPGRYQTALRQIDRAMFTFANRSEHGNDRKYLLDVLRALGRAEQTSASGLAFCKDKFLRPLSGLSSQWLDQANDGSAEFRLAASLAGINRKHDGEFGPLRVFLEEVEMKGNYPDWSPGSTSAVWSKKSLTANLAAVFQRRQMEAFRAGRKPRHTATPHPASLNDVIAFLYHETDDDKLTELLWGLIGVEFSTEVRQPEASESHIPFEFGVPRLLVQENSFTANGDFWKLSYTADANAKAVPDVFHALASDRDSSVESCVTAAARRLKSGGLLVTGYRNREQAGRPLAIVSAIQPRRLLAAMLFPLSDRALVQIANSVLYSPENKD